MAFVGEDLAIFFVGDCRFFFDCLFGVVCLETADAPFNVPITGAGWGVFPSEAGCKARLEMPEIILSSDL